MRDTLSFDNATDSLTKQQSKRFPLLDWQALLVRVLPGRFLLAAFLFALGTGVDLPWLGEHTAEILGIRGAVVVGLIVTSYFSRYCKSQRLAEAIVTIGSLISITAMAVLGMVEGTYIMYTSAIYQVLIFVLIFLPISIPIYAGLLVTVGTLWFGLFPFLFPVILDQRFLVSHGVGFLTFSIMLLAGSRLFLQLRAEEAEKRVYLESYANRLQDLAIRDGLTGVYNYRHFQDSLPMYVENAKKNGEPLSLCLIDLNDFKVVNDLAGHTVGNVVLERVAHSLITSVRQSDQVFRIGGDEFAVVIPETTANDARYVAERIQTAMASLKIREYWAKQEGLPTISCSIGIAELSPNTSTYEDLAKVADHALYQAKAAKGVKSGRVIVA